MASKSDAVSQKNSCSEPRPLVRTDKRKRKFNRTSLETHFSILTPHKEMLSNSGMIFLIHNCLKEAMGKPLEGISGVGNEAITGVFVTEVVLDPPACVFAAIAARNNAFK